MSVAQVGSPTSPHVGWLSRGRCLALAFIITTGVVVYLCYRLIVPFLPPLAWALALAVMVGPLHRRYIVRWISSPGLAAGVSVLIVALLVVVPVVLVSQRIVRQATRATDVVQSSLASGSWRSVFDGRPVLKPVESWVESQFGLTPRETAEPDRAGSTEAAEAESPDAEKDSEATSAGADRATEMLTRGLGNVVTGTIWLVMQFFITFMTLFFFFRDRQQLLRVLRSLLPLSHAETNEIFARVDDTIHCTIYGSLVVACVQGFMGGLMFLFLGLPTPLLWGAIMALFAVVPLLGTFVIWAPAAAYLVATGEWTKALILVTWGALAIGMIDNVLYPYLVGGRLKLHTLLVFFAILGGISLFGASGMVLGPLVLSSADALLDIWTRRTAFGGTIEKAVEPAVPSRNSNRPHASESGHSTFAGSNGALATERGGAAANSASSQFASTPAEERPAADSDSPV